YFSLILLLLPQTYSTQIYTLSLPDALPISQPGTFQNVSRNGTDAVMRTPTLAQRGSSPRRSTGRVCPRGPGRRSGRRRRRRARADRKSTRLNSSHQIISYAVFCLKKKNRAI